MKLLYKTVASVSMLLLSTAAALGVRRVALSAKKRKEEREKAEVIVNKAKTSDGKEIVTFASECGEQDFSEDFDLVQDDVPDEQTEQKPMV